MYHIDVFQNNLKSIYPEVFLLVATCMILVYAVIYNPMSYFKYPILTTVIGWLSVQILVLTALLIGNQSIPSSTVILNNVLIIDDFSVLIKVIVLFSALSSILISFDYIKKQKINSFEYMILILFSTLSMLLIVSSYDLISMYLAIEFQSLSFYVLAAFKRSDEFSTEAGLKYFILGALSSGLLLFGESILYGFTGITNFEELSKLLSFHSLSTSNIMTSVFDSNTISTYISINAVIIGILFMLVAFLFKISAAPFHMWTPDVYEGAPTSVTAFFAITPKIAILSLLLRLCLFTFWDAIESWQSIIIFSALLSIFIGTFGAINQNRLKRLFAYSSIAHVGYMLIGLSVATVEAVESVLVYILLYIPMLINVFGILLAMSKGPLKTRAGSSWNNSLFYNSNNNTNPILTSYIYKLKPQDVSSKFSQETSISTSFQNWEFQSLKASLPIWNPFNISTMSTDSQMPLNGAATTSFTSVQKKDLYLKYLTDLAGFAKSNRILAASFAIILFSNAGVPPLAGFYGKLNVFLAAVESSMYFIAIAGVVCSVMGAFYSIRVVKIIYFHSLTSAQNEWTTYTQISKLTSIILALTFFFTLFFFLYPSFLFTITHLAALSLFI